MSNLNNPLRKVDKLRITFLVDNCIEWLTKLPPGFTLELPQHLQEEHHPVIDPETNTPILDFDKFCCVGSVGAHGFSALIETEIIGETRTILFDTGPDSSSLVRNVGAMHVPINKIERIITSHWHADHTGGLLSFLKLRETSNANVVEPVVPCVVDTHPDRPIARGIAPGPLYDKVICRLPSDPTFEQIEAAGGVVEKHAERHLVAGGMVYVSGEIPRVTPFETGLPGGTRWIQDVGWVDEPAIMDERYAAIDVAGKGLVLFSACSHAGIVNVVKDAIATFSRPVYMIVGGLHLAGDSMTPRIEPTIQFLSQLYPAPTYVLPMHCTGFAAKVALEQVFGEGIVPAGVGIRVDVVGDREYDKRLPVPVIRDNPANRAL